MSKYDNYPAIHANGAQVSKMYNAIWRRVVAMNFLILPTIACSVVIQVHIVFREYLTTEFACLMAAALVINWYLYFIPPSSSGVNHSNKSYAIENHSIVSLTAIIEMILFFLGQLRESLQLYLSSLQAKLDERLF